MAPKIKLDKNLIEILLTPAFDNFTVLELRSVYLTKTMDPSITKVDARRYVYRHIRRLEKKGLLQKKESSGGRRVYYSKSKALNEESLVAQTVTEKTSDVEQHPGKERAFYSELKMKLGRYKSDLLSALGEMEEYRALRETFPALAKTMEDVYRQASEECSKVHGRIKAIEKLLAIGHSEDELNASS